MNIAWPENILGDKNWDKFEFFQGVWVSQVRGLRSEVWGLRFQGLNFRDTWKERAGKGGGGWDSLWDEPHAQDIINAQENPD